MAGEIVVIAGVVIARGLPTISHGADDRQMMRLFRRQGQMLTEPDLRRRGADGVEGTAIFGRRVRLHVPGVDVRRATAEKKEDRGLGGALGRNG